MSGLNLYPTLASHADPLKSRPLVCVCFGPQCKICVLHGCCVLVHTLFGLFVFKERELIIRKYVLIWYLSQTVIRCATTQTSDQMMSCTINSSLCLSLSLLHFTTHASTFHLRNCVGNCVTVTVLIHRVCVCVCVMSVFMLSVCLCVCVCERTSVLGWWSHWISILYMCEFDCGRQWSHVVCVSVCVCSSTYLRQWTGICAYVCVSYGWVYWGQSEKESSQVFRLFAEVTGQWFMTGHFNARLTGSTQASRPWLANPSDLRTFSSLWEPHTQLCVCVCLNV